MGSKGPISENTLFLFNCIQTGGVKKIDFNVVGKALGLQTGTASMRWRRLKTRIEKTPDTAAATTTTPKAGIDGETVFLYNCIIACDCKFDWTAVGKAMALKPATASMRWRRLKERIEAGGDADTTKTASNRKRKLRDESSDIESRSEDQAVKKIKMEEDEKPTKRQTRGKVLNFQDLLDSSSATGSTILDSETSVYTASGANESSEQDDEDMGDPSKDQGDQDTLQNLFKVVKPVAPTKAPKSGLSTSPASNAVKSTSPKSPKARKISNDRLEFNPWEDAMPPPSPNPMHISPLSADLIHSINEDHEQVKADFAGFRTGMTIPNLAPSPSPTVDNWETAPDRSAAARTSAIGTHDTYFEEASVAPEDSVSVAGRVSASPTAKKMLVKKNEREEVKKTIMNGFGLFTSFWK